MKIKGIYKVVYIGPFYTGFFIDTATLINTGYLGIQEKVLNNLKIKDKKEWFIEDGKKKDVLWDIEFTSVYGGTTKIPTSFIGKKASPSNKTIEFNDVKFNFEEGIFFYHDFGVGTFRITVNVELNEEMEVRKYRELVEQFSSKIGKVFNPLLERDTDDLFLTLKTLSISTNSYVDFSNELKKKGLQHLSIKSCLWYHRAFIFEIERNSPISQEDYDNYKDVLFSSQIKGPQNCSLNEYAQVYPSFNFSLFIYDINNRPKDIRLNRILELAEYYYAATSLLDTILFNKFSEISGIKEKPPKINELKKDLESLKTLSEQLDLFLLILKDSIVNFSPSSVIMWRNLDNEWYYTPLLESLREKSQILDTKLHDKLDDLTQKRTETMNRLIKIFTIFAIIGPLLELYSIANDLNLIDFIINNVLIIGSIISPLMVGILLTVYFKHRKGLTT